jgi:2,3-bisphosphoglycerate-dependent phosphoglycerate mutase
MPKTQKTEKPILYLFRHTETEDNVNRVFSGCRRNPKLTQLGKQQAEALAEKLKNKEIDLFISPPLSRCEQTLTPLRRYFPNTPYEQRAELVERDYGDLTGKNKLEIMRLNPKKAVLWRRSWDVAPPNGESIKQVWEGRIKQFCKWLEQKMKNEKINVAYSGTNNTVRLIRMYFEKLSIEEMLTMENPYGDYASYSL